MAFYEGIRSVVCWRVLKVIIVFDDMPALAENTEPSLGPERNLSGYHWAEEELC